MAHSGGARPSISMRLVNGRLIEGTIAQRQGVESHPAKAAARILQGETVFVQLYADIVDRTRWLVTLGLERGES